MHEAQTTAVAALGWIFNHLGLDQLTKQKMLKDNMDKFSCDWLVSDVRDMKRRTPVASWRQSLYKLLSLEPMVVAVEKEILRLNKMHQHIGK